MITAALFYSCNTQKYISLLKTSKYVIDILSKRPHKNRSIMVYQIILEKRTNLEGNVVSLPKFYIAITFKVPNIRAVSSNRIT